jgi:hypothetical protein
MLGVPMKNTINPFSGFKLSRLKSAVATMLLAAATSSFAADYFVVVPVPAKTTTGQNINVSLSGYLLPAGLIGQPYAGFDFKSLLAVTGDTQYTGYGVHWSVAQGSLPAGLTLSSDGKLGGTPTAAGTATFQVMASYKNKAGQQGYQVYIANITVGLGAATPPQAIVGQAYSYNLNSKLSVVGDPSFNGTGVMWSVVSSTLPAGLYLTSDGWIGGTPTAGGTGSITARATYRGVNGQQTYQVVSLNITVGLAGATPPQGMVSQAYSYDLKPLLTVGGDPGYDGSGVTWSVVSGALPDGLSLSSNGVISGTPTTSTTATFEVKAAYRTSAGDQSYQLFIAKLPGDGTLSVTSLDFGGMAVGTATSGQTVSLTNTGGDTLAVNSITSTGPFAATNGCPATLAPNQSCTSSVTFKPTAMGPIAGTVKMSTSAGDRTVNLSGTGLATLLTASPTTVAFGNVNANNTAKLPFTVTNTGNTATTSLKYTLPANVTKTDTCGQALGAGASCTVTLTWLPTGPSTLSGNVTVASQDSQASVSLSGTGLQAVMGASPTALAFGTQQTGTTVTKTVMLTNSGNAAATSLELSVPSGYLQSSNCGTSLAGGASCTVQVSFTPSAATTYNGVLSVTSSAGPLNVNITGAGGVSTFALSTGSIAMPMANIGTSTSSAFTITNNGTVAGTPSITATANFSATQCGSLAPGQSCTPTVYFTPNAAQTASQSYSGSVTVTGSSAGAQGIALTGLGASASAQYGTYPAGTQLVYSQNQQYGLYMQGDCNLVIYHGQTVAGNAVWASGSNGKGAGCYLGVQTDGNLVVYNQSNAVMWMTQTGGHSGATFIQLDNNGILHMYMGTPSAPGALLWSS